MRKANKNPTEISRVLGRHKSTIYRELKHNLGKRGYRAVQAHQFAVERHIYFIPEITARLTTIAILPVSGMIIHLQESALRTSVLQEMI